MPAPRGSDATLAVAPPAPAAPGVNVTTMAVMLSAASSKLVGAIERLLEEGRGARRHEPSALGAKVPSAPRTPEPLGGGGGVGGARLLLGGERVHRGVLLLEHVPEPIGGDDEGDAAEVVGHLAQIDLDHLGLVRDAVRLREGGGGGGAGW